jgi:ATP-binding cassette subfamily B protein
MKGRETRKTRKTKSLHSKLLKSGKYNLFDFIYITFQVTPIFSFIYIIDKLIKAVIPALQVLVTASFIDKAVKIFEGKLDIRDLYISLLFLILIITFQYIDSVFMNIIKSKLSIKLNEIFKTIIIEKQARIEYKHIENTNSWDLVSRVCDRPVERILSGFQNILEGFELYIRVLAILLVLLVNVWWTAIIIIAFSVPLFYIAVKSGQTNYEAFKEAKKYERRSNYLHSIITDRDSVDERSLFSYTKAVNDLWYQENEKSRITKLKAELKNFIKMKSASLVTLLISLLISAVLILPLSKGLITTGLFIALIKEVFNLVQTMSWELSDVTEELANNIEYMKDLAAFSGLSETQMILDIPDKTVLREEFSSLEFKDVSF